MNKADFLKELAAHLRDLTSQEQKEIMQDFEEHFEMGRTEGKTDEEIIQSLGSPQQIAKELQPAQEMQRNPVQPPEQSQASKIGIIIALIFFNLLIVLGPSIGIAGVILGIWVTALSFVAQLFIAGVQWVIQPVSFYMFELFASITLAAVGLLLFTAAKYITKAAVRIFSKYIAFQVRLVKGGNSSW